MNLIKYTWHALIAICTLALMFLVGPKVYDQIQYQFFDPDGDPSMWPATFEGILILFAIPVTSIALIFSTKEKKDEKNNASRIASGILGASLLIMWIYGAKLVQDFHSSLLPNLPQKLIDKMIGNDGALIILTGLVLHFTYSISGRGIGVWIWRLLPFARNKSEPDADNPANPPENSKNQLDD